MPLILVRNDITKMAVDAIVAPGNTALRGGGGADGMIRAAAGAEMEEACRALGGCAVGEAKLTRGYKLPCRYVIHTVGPRWRGGLFGEKRQLAACYRAALSLAAEKCYETVAFPLISAGSYGYPADKAMKVAVETIAAFLMEHEMTVYLVLFGSESVTLGRRLSAEIREYIDDRYVETHANRRRASREGDFNAADDIFAGTILPPEESAIAAPMQADEPTGSHPVFDDADFLPQMSAAPSMASPREDREAKAAALQPTASLESRLGEIDESFQQMLLRKIDERGMTDAQCYKRANLDRKLFSIIRGNVHYRPKKTTAIALAVALELGMPETEELLRKAGFALSRSSKFDIIVSYFIEHGNYNIFEINEALFFYDQSLLG